MFVRARVIVKDGDRNISISVLQAVRSKDVLSEVARKIRVYSNFFA